MIVIDASAALDLVLDRPPHHDAIRKLVQGAAPAVFAPHLIDAEVTSVLRRQVLAKALTAGEALMCLEDFTALPITRHPHLPFLERAFELRQNATVYDALYLVLAEALGATLVTRDGALASVPGVHAKVRVIV